jgi:PhnB protein
MKLEAYLSFDGRCEEAIEFYKSALGARVNMLMRFKDAPQPPAAGTAPAGAENKVMHASLSIGESTLLASDCRSAGQARFEGFSLALTAGSDAEARRFFERLAEGGTVHAPLAKTFFASSFGVVADRFGISWMVLAPQAGTGGPR